MKHTFALALLLLAPAFGQSDEQLYAEGQYDVAVRAGLAEHDARGFCNAARATLADEASRDQRCLSCLKRAEDFARHAIAADSRSSDGYIYLAITLGLESRIEGYSVARSKGYASQAKRALDAALAIDPDNAWAMAGLGGWNIEVVRGGGSVLAYLLYGATVDRGRNYFNKAFQQSPDNAAIRYQYALSLAGYDAQRYRADIEDSLSRAANGQVDTAYGRLLQTRARELLTLLRKGDAVMFAARVRGYEGYLTTAGG
jgi:hypothetical protein